MAAFCLQRLDTVVGKLETKLSGGETLRIEIVTATLMKSGILLLDAAARALDAKSEYIMP
jgi:ABC-type multidrug transport system fused ATPase/permease subunit